MFDNFLIPASLTIHTYTPPLAYIILCLTIIVALTYFKKSYEAVIFSTGFIVTSGSVFVLKHTFAVPRPSEALLQLNDYAFPSSHAALSMFLATALTWLLLCSTKPTRGKKLVLITIFFSLALLVGLSRLVIHVHTPLQIFIGAILGIAIPYGIIRLTKHFNPLNVPQNNAR
jgi:membrane-associated phospholipid phosphatase